jgi:hypothetical protein
MKERKRNKGTLASTSALRTRFTICHQSWPPEDLHSANVVVRPPASSSAGVIDRQIRHKFIKLNGRRNFNAPRSFSAALSSTLPTKTV